MKLTVQFKQFNTHTHTPTINKQFKVLHLQIGRGENLCTSFCWSIYRVQCTLNQCKRAYTIEMITFGACVCVCVRAAERRDNVSLLSHSSHFSYCILFLWSWMVFGIELKALFSVERSEWIIQVCCHENERCKDTVNIRRVVFFFVEQIGFLVNWMKRTE